MLRSAPQPTRRAVLGGALAGLLLAPALTACTGADDGDEAPAGPDPDVVAAERAAEREQRLLAAYDAALVLAPQLSDRLLPLRADHAAHLTALGLPEEPAQPAASASAPPAPAVAVPALPADPTALLAELAELERRASTLHGRRAVLSGRGVGAVLASLAASEAAHVVALT